jgi:hypothetical protein
METFRYRSRVPAGLRMIDGAPTSRLQCVAGAAFVVSVVLIVCALTVLLFARGDASGPVSAIAAGSLVAFIVGMLGLRSVVTEQSLRPLGLTSLAALVATIGASCSTSAAAPSCQVGSSA